MKKTIALIMALLMLGAALAGCSSDSVSDGSEQINDSGSSYHYDNDNEDQPYSPEIGNDTVTLINNTEGMIEYISINSNDEEYCDIRTQVDIPDGYSYTIRSFSRIYAPYEKPVDMIFDCTSVSYACHVRGMDIRPGDTIRIWLEDDPDAMSYLYLIPVFEVVHADGSSRTYYGSNKSTVDGTDRKLGSDSGF